MCDPVSMFFGSGGAKVVKGLLGSDQSPLPTPPDPAIERQKAEAEASASANRKLAADRMRRREQQSLISRGAPSLGEQGPANLGLITTPPAQGAKGLGLAKRSLTY